MIAVIIRINRSAEQESLEVVNNVNGDVTSVVNVQMCCLYMSLSVDVATFQPHSWNGLADTRIHLSQLHKLDPVAQPESNREGVTILSDIFGIDSHPLSSWGKASDSGDLDAPKPNAVVVHSDKGLEVMRVLT